MNGNGGQYNVAGKIPQLSQLRQYNVNRPDQVEGIWNPLYHYQTYADGGYTQLGFFQTNVGAAGVTLSTTNMKTPGMLPRPQEFLCVGIQVYYRGSTTISTSAATPAAYANWNHVESVLESPSWLSFTIGSKDYVQDGPIVKFPQQFGLTGVMDSSQGADSDTTALTVIQGDYARSQGRYYAITPLKIPANQNFIVTLNWDTAVDVDTGTRIGVILDGYLYRLSQ